MRNEPLIGRLIETVRIGHNPVKSWLTATLKAAAVAQEGGT